MLFIAGLSIALFISALLLVKKNKSSSDYFLFVWMLLNSCHLAFHYLSVTEMLYDYPSLLGIQLPFPLFQGVMLYFYVCAVTNQCPKKRWHLLLHLLPAILAYVYLIGFFFLPASEKIEIFKMRGGEEYFVFMSILQLAVLISGVIYIIWCSWLLIKHKRNIRSQFSDIEEINLSWLQFLVGGLGVVWTLVIFTMNDQIIYQAVAVFVILIGFFGVQQKNIFNQQISENTKDTRVNAPVKKVEKEKYQNSGLSKEHAEEHFKELTKLMQADQVYKDASLSLGELASMLDLHPNYLSQIINEEGGQSFYDFVNGYRVEAFKKMALDESNAKYTLMTLAFECGFNSKSSFNRYFKKITGQTPSQFTKK